MIYLFGTHLVACLGGVTIGAVFAALLAWRRGYERGHEDGSAAVRRFVSGGRL